MWIYTIGLIIAVLLLSLLSIYYSKFEDSKIEDFGLAMIITLLSWLTVFMLLFSYWDKYKILFDNVFKSKEP